MLYLYLFIKKFIIEPFDCLNMSKEGLIRLVVALFSIVLFAMSVLILENFGLKTFILFILMVLFICVVFFIELYLRIQHNVDRAYKIQGMNNNLIKSYGDKINDSLVTYENNQKRNELLLDGIINLLEKTVNIKK